MSIYHRYAVYYSCSRYLDKVEKVKEIASRCNIVDDCQTYSMIRLASGTDNGHGPSEGMRSTTIWDDENTKRREGSDKEIDSSSNDEKMDRHFVPRDLDENQIPQPGTSSVDNNGSLAAPSAHAIASHDDDRLLFNISKAQMEQLLLFHRILGHVVGFLLKNIKRVESESNTASLKLIDHYWNEAARLNGSGRIRSPRMQRITGVDWWRDDSDDLAMSERGACRCSSPLLRAFEPDDLAWEDEVAQWEQGLGRATDDLGRRFVKM